MNTTADILHEGLRMLRDEIIEAHYRAGQKATGRTAGLMSVSVPTSTRGELWVPSYFSVLEDGRRPGRVPYNFEEILRRWAEAKGLHFSSYYMLAKKIKEEGTKLYRDGGRRDVFSGTIENFEKWITSTLSGYYKIEVTNQIRDALK